MWKNTVEWGRPQMTIWRMRIILIDFQLQEELHVICTPRVSYGTQDITVSSLHLL